MDSAAATVEVRQIRGPDEIDALGEVTLAAFSSLPADVLSDGYGDELRDVAGRAAAAMVFVALVEGHVVGGVTYVPGPDNPLAEFTAAEEAGIRMLSVDPAAQGRGVGAALVAACLDAAAAAGKARVALHTTPWMTGAQRLYERLGFRRAPERDWHPTPAVPLLGYVLDLDGPTSAMPAG